MRGFIFAMLVAGWAGAAPAAGPAPAAEEEGKEKPEAKPEAVTVQTGDGWKLAGTYWPVQAAEAQKVPAVILVHMLGRQRDDWNPLVPRLTEAGCAVLAFDLRGHGASEREEGKTPSWRGFKAKDWRAAEGDILAARDWLVQNRKEVDAERIALVGASIGANLALRALASDEKLRGACLLSPGLDYRGVRTEDALEKVRPAQRVAAFACRNDLESATCVRSLERALQAVDRDKRPAFAARVWPGRVLPTATGGLHGTRMLGRVKGLEDEILRFLAEATAPLPKEEEKRPVDPALDALQRAL